MASRYATGLLLVGAATHWYIVAYARMVGAFETYWVAFGTAHLLLLIGLLWHIALGVRWLVQKARA